MTISRRALDWFSALLQAALVVALVPAALAWADCPVDSCDKCKSCPLQAVDWTAIYLGNFATGCALTNPDQTHECPIECDEACIASKTVNNTWCPGPSLLAHDPCQICPSTGDWGLRIDGSKVSLSVDSFSAFKAPPLDCPNDENTDHNLFRFFESVIEEPLAANPTTNEQEIEERPLQLRPGESAQEILGIARRLGPGPLHGTIFDDEPATTGVPIPGVPIPGMDRCFRAQRNGDSLARAIRVLEARDRQQRYESPNIEAAFEDSAEQVPLRATETYGNVEPIDRPPESLGATSARIDALRQAGRMLDKAANLLEEQALYDRADELRGQAQFLRQDARENQARFWKGGVTSRPMVFEGYAR